MANNATTVQLMTPASGPNGPLAQPVYLVDQYGNPILSTNGSPVTNDGTFAKETGGNLATLAGAIASSRFLADLRSVNGAALAYSNPVITQDAIRATTNAGKHFHATTGLLTSGTTNFRAAQIFNPLASGVTLYVYSALVIFNSANFHSFYMTTQTAVGNVTGWTDAAMSKVNMDGGNANASAATVSYSSTDTSSTIGTIFESVGTQNNVPVEAFTNGEVIRLTAGNGILFVLKQGAANNWGITWGWMEY